jgi:hypothetical protein
MDQADIMASPKLRVVFVIIAASMLALWGWSLIPPIETWGDPNEDGFSYVPAFWATLTCLLVGIYLLAGAIAGRGRPVEHARTALFLGVVILVIVAAFLIIQTVANSVADH